MSLRQIEVEAITLKEEPALQCKNYLCRFFNCGTAIKMIAAGTDKTGQNIQILHCTAQHPQLVQTDATHATCNIP